MAATGSSAGDVESFCASSSFSGEDSSELTGKDLQQARSLKLNAMEGIMGERLGVKAKETVRRKTRRSLLLQVVSIL